MIIKYENNILTAVDPTIRSSDSIIKLTTDINDSIFLGILHLSNGITKVIEFVENNDAYIGRLIVDEEMVSFLSNVTFSLQISNGNLVKTTQHIKIKFDLSSIKNDIKIKISNEYKELLQRINELEEKIKYPSSKFVDDINIINKGSIKKGMIPVALDSKTFVALYPFSNHVLSVNGQTAADGAVIIDSSMIKYKTGRTVEATIQDLIDAIVAVNASVKTISDDLKEIRNQINDLDVRLAKHVNDGII